MNSFNVDRAAEAAWEYCGKNGAYQNISPSVKAKVDKKVSEGTDIHYVYKHQCVGVLRRTWTAIGLNIPGMNSCGNPSEYMGLLDRNPNFYKKVGQEILSRPRFGDVVLYHGGSTVGHGCIYLPIKGHGHWVSDAVQNGWNVYVNATNKAHDISCYRFVGDVQGDGGNAAFPVDSGGSTTSAGNSAGWQSAVDRMKSWYETNIHTYVQGSAVDSCPLLNGGKVRRDCSGFVNACLCLYGIQTYDTQKPGWPPSSAFMLKDDYYQKLSNDFIRMEYNKEELQPYDIMVGNGHTEIYAGERKSFSWGNVHDIAHGGMPSGTAWNFGGGKTYSIIYRCNGNGGMAGTSLTPEELASELADKCPSEIEFKGLWMRYHLCAGTRSPIINEIMQSHPAFGTGDGLFGGAGAGLLPIPPGFYSDTVLYKFISTAEGSIGVQWVGTDHGHDIVTDAACFGYDFPGGVHDPSYIKKLGLTPSDAAGLGISSRGRKPIGGESYGGRVKWGWYTNPLPADHPYWQKLIPYYRDAMIWAWNQPIIQAVKDPAERLARMHSINWWGSHYLKGFSGGSGWPHRFKAAQAACAGMPQFT